MADLDHTFGGDLAISANGDLLTAETLLLSQQNVLRRLLTNAKAYLWNPTYGAGLPAYVGSTVDEQAIEALIRSQMALEQTVVQNPPPIITIATISNGIAVNIKYTEAESGDTVILAFDVEP